MMDSEQEPQDMNEWSLICIYRQNVGFPMIFLDGPDGEDYPYFDNIARGGNIRTKGGRLVRLHKPTDEFIDKMAQYGYKFDDNYVTNAITLANMLNQMRADVFCPHPEIIDLWSCDDPGHLICGGIRIIRKMLVKKRLTVIEQKFLDRINGPRSHWRMHDGKYYYSAPMDGKYILVFDVAEKIPDCSIPCFGCNGGYGCLMCLYYGDANGHIQEQYRYTKMDIPYVRGDGSKGIKKFSPFTQFRMKPDTEIESSPDSANEPFRRMLAQSMAEMEQEREKERKREREAKNKKNRSTKEYGRGKNRKKDCK